MNSCSLETIRWSSGSESVAVQVHLPLHRRLAVNQLTTVRWSLDQALAGYRRGGIPAIGLSLSKMAERGLEHAVDEVREAGLFVSTVGPIGGFTGCDGQRWEDAVRNARMAIWVAGRVGAQAVTVVTGPRRTHIRSHARRIVVDALRELASSAAHHGVRLALQPMHACGHGEWTFLHRLDDALSILDDVGNPWVGLAYSPFHLSSEPRLWQRIPEIVPRIATVQLSDCCDVPAGRYDRRLPGDGTLGVDRHIHALEAAGYRGLYEIDPWHRDLWNRPPDGLIAECRRRFERLCIRPTARDVI